METEEILKTIYDIASFGFNYPKLFLGLLIGILLLVVICWLYQDSHDTRKASKTRNTVNPTYPPATKTTNDKRPYLLHGIFYGYAAGSCAYP